MHSRDVYIYIWEGDGWNCCADAVNIYTLGEIIEFCPFGRETREGHTSFLSRVIENRLLLRQQSTSDRWHSKYKSSKRRGSRLFRGEEEGEELSVGLLLIAYNISPRARFYQIGLMLLCSKVPIFWSLFCLCIFFRLRYSFDLHPELLVLLFIMEHHVFISLFLALIKRLLVRALLLL